MHIIFRFVLAGLATWRLSFLLAREDGPGRVFARLREKSGSGLLGELAGCVKCLGMWIALPFTLFVHEGGWAEFIVIWLALGAVPALIDEWLRPPFAWKEANEDELLRGNQDGSHD